MKKTIYVFLFNLFAFSCFAQKSPKVDSLTGSVTTLSREVGELKRDNSDLKKDLERSNEKLDDYNDMFKQQWDFFEKLLSIVGLVIAIGLPALGLVTFNRLKKDVNERLDSMQTQIIQTTNQVKASQETIRELKIDLLKQIAYSNRMTANGAGNDLRGIYSAFESLRLYLQCYRLQPGEYFAQEIDTAASYLFRTWSDEPERRSLQVSEAMILDEFIDFDFLLTTNDLPQENHENLLFLYKNLDGFIERAIPKTRRRIK